MAIFKSEKQRSSQRLILWGDYVAHVTVICLQRVWVHFDFLLSTSNDLCTLAWLPNDNFISTKDTGITLILHWWNLRHVGSKPFKKRVATTQTSSFLSDGWDCWEEIRVYRLSVKSKKRTIRCPTHRILSTHTISSFSLLVEVGEKITQTERIKTI